MALVYLATNKANGKQYVGFTTQTLVLRRTQHEYQATRGATHCPLFYRALRKYGVNGFDWVQLAEGPDEDMLALERSEILARGCQKPAGYNLSSGGDKPLWHPETRARMSDLRRGVPQDPELVAKRVAKLKGQKRSADEVERMRERAKGYAPARRTITEEQELDLIARHVAGATLEALAAVFGISQTTVHKYLKRAGRTGTTADRRKLNDVQVQELSRLRAQGMSLERAGALLGVSTDTASVYMRRLGQT